MDRTRRLSVAWFRRSGPISTSLTRAMRAFARSSRASATERAYASDWRDFEAWCDRAGVDPLPAAPATIGR